MDTKNQNKKGYDVQDASRIVGRHPMTIKRRIRAGDIEADIIDGKYIISHDDMVAYLHSINLPPEIIEYRLHGKPLSTSNSNV